MSTLNFTAFSRYDPDHARTNFNCLSTVVVMGSVSTTSSSYADVTGVSVSFTKIFTSSRLKVEFGAPAYCQTSSSAVTYAAQVNSVDTEVGNRLYNDLLVRDWVTGVNVMASSLTAGTYTVKLRWKRLSGTGTITLDSSSVVWMHVQEVRL